MNISTLIPLAGGLTVGYLLGTAAGRSRFEQLKQGVATLANHPEVQQAAFDLAGRVRESSNKLPGAAGHLIDTAAASVQDRLTRPDDEKYLNGTSDSVS